MKRKFILRLILVFIFLIMLMGIGKIWPAKKTTGKSTKITVVTSFYPLYFLTSEIGGARIEVKNLVPAGVEPHDYEPTARDLMTIKQAKLLILNGGSLEVWGEKTKEDLKETRVRVVEAGEGLWVDGDPHLWLSPEMAKKMGRAILKGLAEADPEGTGEYKKREMILEEELSRLQEDYRTGLAGCRKKEIVTSHAAFGYLAGEFGLKQVAIAGLSPDEEPSIRQLSEIAKFAQTNGIKYIFFENLVSPKLAETIATEVGAKTLVLDPLEGISDNDRAQGKNYLTIMENNLTNLRTALECQ